MPSLENVTDDSDSQSFTMSGSNIVFHCVLNEEQELLSKVFDDNTNEFYDQGQELLNSKDETGKSPIELACILDRTDILQELIKRGVDPNSSNISGYSPLHFAACWGHRRCLEILVRHGATVDCRTKYGETARQLAVRYKHSDSISFIDWAAAKATLTRFIAHVRESVTDPEKLQGVKLTKDEKSTAIGACNEKLDWIENNPSASMEEFLFKKSELEKQVEDILNKTNSPAPPTGSSGKK